MIHFITWDSFGRFRPGAGCQPSESVPLGFASCRASRSGSAQDLLPKRTPARAIAVVEQPTMENDQFY